MHTDNPWRNLIHISLGIQPDEIPIISGAVGGGVALLVLVAVVVVFATPRIRQRLFPYRDRDTWTPGSNVK
jgi:hypothetical protein